MPKKPAKSAKSAKSKKPKEKVKVVERIVEKIVEKPVEEVEEKVVEKVVEKPAEEVVEKAAEPVAADVPAESELSEQTVETLKERPLEEEVPLEKKNKKLFWIGMIMMGIVLVLTGWFICQASKAGQESEEEVAEEVVTETEEGEEAVVQLEREDISLEVLNGAGIAGEAGRVSEIFEDLGYEISEIGNADLIEDNELYINPDIDEDTLEILLEDVEDELDIEESSGDLEDSEATARIVLGS